MAGVLLVASHRGLGARICARTPVGAHQPILRSAIPQVEAAIAGVGEKGLLTPYAGELFSSFLGIVREGRTAQTLYDLPATSRSPVRHSWPTTP